MGSWGNLPRESDDGLDEWHSKLPTVLSSKKTYTQWWNERIPTLAKIQGGKGKRAWTYDDHLNSYYVFFDLGMDKKNLKEGIKNLDEAIEFQELQNPRTKANKRYKKEQINKLSKHKQAFEMILDKGIPKSASKKAGLILAKAIVKYDANDGFSMWRSPKERKSALVKLAKKLGAPASAFEPIAKKKTTTKKKKAPAKKKTVRRVRKAPTKKKTTTKKKKAPAKKKTVRRVRKAPAKKKTTRRKR